MLHAALPLLVLSPALGPADSPPLRDAAAPLATTIDGVVVYPGSAAVRRVGTVPAGGGVFAVEGLPFGLDPDSLRVRLADGEVVGVEVLERFQPNVPDERVAAVRERVRELRRALQALRDERGVLDALREHVQRELAEPSVGPEGQRPDPAEREANFAYLGDKLAELTGELREIGWRIEEAELALSAAEVELGRCEGQGGVRLRDVRVDVESRAGGPIEVEYLVGGAGWTPLYDLRARQDLSAVELVYRAQVWQESGEDWRDAEVLLSTARPERGARGPDPRPVWLRVVDAKRGKDGWYLGRGERGELEALRALGYSDAEAAAYDDAGVAAEPALPYAEVEEQGLSLRYRLARRETIESRREPTNVLVGRAELALEPEHYCVPALDPTVWLRARTSNTSPWVILPGKAAVYFGSDFLGNAALATVQAGQEFTLHLGADAGLAVTRTQLTDLRGSTGFFSSKEARTEAWRVEIENHDGFSARPDGRVSVVVQEALPRSTDERVRVEIEKAEPRPAAGERWEKEREEKSVVTWVLDVPRGEARRIDLTTTIRFPEGLQIVRR